jgi:hypothetical protein
MEVDWALAGLKLEQWFYYEPGRIWVEHGCQYDPENAFRYFLRGDLSHADDMVHEAEHDMPLGNFFQRYLYNGFGHVTFIVPTTRANPRYMRWLLLNQPRLLFGVLTSHLPFVRQVLRRLAKTAATPRAKNYLRGGHEAALADLARTSGLGERLFAIEKLKEVNADVLRSTRTIGLQLLFAVLTTVLVMLSGLGLWYVALAATTAINTGLMWKALLFMSITIFMIATAGGALIYSLVRTPRAAPAKPVQRAAQRLVDVLDVPVVSFGHTHEETLIRLRRPNGGRAWYYNTGTWIAVFTHDVLMPRERVQYTFLRVRGDEGELLHWSPGRGEPLQVILLDETTLDGWGTAPATASEPAPQPAPSPAAAPTAVAPPQPLTPVVTSGLPVAVVTSGLPVAVVAMEDPARKAG